MVHLAAECLPLLSVKRNVPCLLCLNIFELRCNRCCNRYFGAILIEQVLTIYSPVKDTVFILHADNRSLTRITLVALLTGLTLVTCLTFLSGLTFVSLLSLHTIGNSNNLSVREDDFITIFLLVYGNDGDSIFILLHDSPEIGNICIHILAESFQFTYLRLKDIHSGRKF